MKKIDHNNFVIDHVFAIIDKGYKKKKKSKKDFKNSISVKNESSQNTNDNEYYTININV